MLAEREFEGPSFDAVIQLGRGAVQVDVLNGGRRNASFAHGKSDGSRRLLAAFLQANAVEGFASRAITAHFGINLGAPGTRVLVLLEHEHPGAFPDYKAITVGRKRTRSALRSFIPRRRENLHQDETFNNA